MFGSNSKFKISTILDYSELWQLVSSSDNVLSNKFFGKIGILAKFVWLKFHINPKSYK